MSSGEPRSPVGGHESSQSARPGRQFGHGDAALRAALSREIRIRRGYGGFANTGEFPALPVTLELPAIPAAAEPSPDQVPGRRSGNRAYRTSWALIANTGGTTALGFVYWVVVAHLYDPRTIGRASALISALLLLSMLTQLNLSSALPKFLPGAGRSSGRRLIAYSYGVSSLAALPVAAGFVLLMPRLSAQWRFLSGSRLLEILFVVAAVVWGVFALEDAALTGLRRAEVVPVENLVYGLLKLVLVICIAKLLPTAGIFASWTVPLLVVIPVVNVLIFRRYIRPGRDSGPAIRVGQVARFTSLDYLASLSAQSYGTLLPLLVLSLLGAAANGSFYIAWTISAGLTLVATNFGMSLMVEAAASPDRLAELTRGIIARCALVTILGAAIVGVAARPILHIYGATYAAHAVSLLVLLALGSIPRAAVIITWSLDRVANRVGRAAFTQAVLALLVLAGSRFLLKYFGIDGVGYAWTAANLAIAVVRLPTLIKGMRPSLAVTPAAAMRTGSPRAAGSVADPAVRPGSTLEIWLGDTLDGLAGVVAIGLVAANMIGSQGIPRMLLALGFLLFVPGRVITANWRALAVRSQATLSMLFSLVILALLATVTLWAHYWHPVGLMQAEAALSVVGLAAAVARRHWRRPAGALKASDLAPAADGEPTDRVSGGSEGRPAADRVRF